jgi:hypothetical protein
VVVTLSPAAAAKIASSGETVLVWSVYYGDATQAPASQRLSVQGRIFIGRQENVEIPGAGVASFKGPTYNTNVPGELVNGQIEVWIQGVSGRHTDPNNFLNCDTIDEVGIQTVAATPVQMHCKLNDES